MEGKCLFTSVEISLKAGSAEVTIVSPATSARLINRCLIIVVELLWFWTHHNRVYLRFWKSIAQTGKLWHFQRELHPDRAPAGNTKKSVSSTEITVYVSGQTHMSWSLRGSRILWKLQGFRNSSYTFSFKAGSLQVGAEGREKPQEKALGHWGSHEFGVHGPGLVPRTPSLCKCQ